jgi:hypothetical protein
MWRKRAADSLPQPPRIDLVHGIARAVDVAAAGDEHRPERIDAQELRCGGIVLAVIEIIELVANVSGSCLVVKLAVEPSGAALWYGASLAMVVVNLGMLIAGSIGHSGDTALRVERDRAFDEYALGIALEDDAQAVWTIYAILVGVDMHAAVVQAHSTDTAGVL